MKNLFLSLYVRLQTLMAREEGQDLVEYALLVALIALVCITGVNQVASAVNAGLQQHQRLAVNSFHNRRTPRTSAPLREGA